MSKMGWFGVVRVEITQFDKSAYEFLLAVHSDYVRNVPRF